MLFGKRKRSIHRILIVEDEPLVAFDNEHFLRDAGYDIVATVDRVGEALRFIATGDLDLVLADIRLSDGSGLDVARAAREKAIPLLFVTGQCPPEARGLAMGVLVKPYSHRELVAAIDALDARIAGRPAKRPPPGLSLF
ncbi:MAG TPA: response regulator [Sphingomonas sp.]|jgi:DNA-binding response OmpR family regulator|uniref:response regulator n=1 Tax=Sphingomonas sp. TaxID=28214 RepID=UPI002ED8D7E8